MNRFFPSRRLCALALVASPLVVVVACSQPASHPGIIGDCTGANCVAGGGAAGSGTSVSTDGSTGTDDSSTADTGTGIDDSGSGGD